MCNISESNSKDRREHLRTSAFWVEIVNQPGLRETYIHKVWRRALHCPVLQGPPCTHRARTYHNSRLQRRRTINANTNIKMTPPHERPTAHTCETPSTADRWQEGLHSSTLSSYYGLLTTKKGCSRVVVSFPHGHVMGKSPASNIFGLTFITSHVRVIKQSRLVPNICTWIAVGKSVHVRVRQPTNQSILRVRTAGFIADEPKS